MQQSNICFCFCRDFTYYKMNNLDNRISNPDQLLTNDVDKFCTSITELYGNISKPMLDIVIYVHKLTATIGGQVRSQTFAGHFGESNLSSWNVSTDPNAFVLLHRLFYNQSCPCLAKFSSTTSVH